jgi:hypothetical protein
LLIKLALSEEHGTIFFENWKDNLLLFWKIIIDDWKL